jgi:hypothetical protein
VGRTRETIPDRLAASGRALGPIRGNPSSVAELFHSKAMPVILTRQHEADLWLEGETIDALKLHWPVAG